MTVRVEIDDAMIVNSFKRLVNAGANPRRALQSVGRYGVSSTRLRFKSQTAPDGTRWKPSKRVLKEGGQTLRLTSRLRNSLTWNDIPNGIEWGTNVRYARPLNDGFNGEVMVPAHQRRSKRAGYVDAIKRTRSGFDVSVKKRAKVEGKLHTVKAHKRRMVIEQRRFLGVSPRDKTAIMDIVGGFLREQVIGSKS
jgi:phage gpG-like protein